MALGSRSCCRGIKPLHSCEAPGTCPLCPSCPHPLSSSVPYLSCSPSFLFPVFQPLSHCVPVPHISVISASFTTPLPDTPTSSASSVLCALPFVSRLSFTCPSGPRSFFVPLVPTLGVAVSPLCPSCPPSFVSIICVPHTPSYISLCPHVLHQSHPIFCAPMSFVSPLQPLPLMLKTPLFCVPPIICVPIPAICAPVTHLPPVPYPSDPSSFMPPVPPPLHHCSPRPPIDCIPFFVSSASLYAQPHIPHFTICPLCPCDLCVLHIPTLRLCPLTSHCLSMPHFPSPPCPHTSTPPALRAHPYSPIPQPPSFVSL